MKAMQKIAGVLTGKGVEEICEACGAKFACGASLRGCWCAEIQLSDAARAELKRKYSRCLCRACLKKVEEGSHA
jgi:hypothetical protein